jgi:hypothetical protein
MTSHDLEENKLVFHNRVLPKGVDIFVVVEESCLISLLSSSNSFGAGAAAVVGKTVVTESDSK